MADWVIEQLASSHERSQFNCGQPLLDAFIRSLVTQYEKRGLGRTFVAVQAGQKQVLGFYTLASGAISFEDLPARAAKKLPRHPIPVVLLARLAVAKPVQGQGLGPLLLVNALKRCLALSREVGIYAVKVDAIDEKAARFYKKYGFIAFSDNPLQLYLAMATVEKGFTF